MNARPVTGGDAISFAHPDVQQCPFSAYDQLRDEKPVYQDPVTGNFILTRYADVRKVLLQPRLFSNRTGLNTTRESTVAEEVMRRYSERGWLPMDTLVSNDLPEHKRYRKVSDKAFTSAYVTSLEPHINSIIDRLIGTFIDKTDYDFLQEFAVLLPMEIIAEQLGIDKADMGDFKIWSDVSVESVSPLITPERELEIADHLIDMQNYLAKVVERARLCPEDTILSRLVHSEPEGDALSTQEILGILHQFLIAGNETTTTTIANGMRVLIDKPELVEELYRYPDKVSVFADEILRLYSPVQTLFRKALQDAVINETSIPAGSIVEVRYGAANRDSRFFECPEDLNLDRSNGKTHLAFGAGIHVCIGNKLARGELRLAFQALTRNMSNFSLSRGQGGINMMDSYIAHGPDMMWMSHTKRK